MSILRAPIHKTIMKYISYKKDLESSLAKYVINFHQRHQQQGNVNVVLSVVCCGAKIQTKPEILYSRTKPC